MKIVLGKRIYRVSPFFPSGVMDESFRVHQLSSIFLNRIIDILSEVARKKDLSLGDLRPVPAEIIEIDELEDKFVVQDGERRWLFTLIANNVPAGTSESALNQSITDSEEYSALIQRVAIKAGEAICT